MEYNLNGSFYLMSISSSSAELENMKHSPRTNKAIHHYFTPRQQDEILQLSYSI